MTLPSKPTNTAIDSWSDLDSAFSGIEQKTLQQSIPAQRNEIRNTGRVTLNLEKEINDAFGLIDQLFQEGRVDAGIEKIISLLKGRPLQAPIIGGKIEKLIGRLREKGDYSAIIKLIEKIDKAGFKHLIKIRT